MADWRELGCGRFPYDTTRYYRLRVENDGSEIRAFIDDKLILTADDGELIRGKAGVTANIPARFQDFRVTASDAVKSRIDERIARREAELAALRGQNPQPKLWKKFDTPKFGAGRNVRFGDLDGDGMPEMLIAQNIPRIGDNFIQISCLTAVTLDGKVLWQLGRPDPRNGLLTADTPFQIHDIDGDGRNEVVMVKDFKLQVLEGRTGRVRKSVWMPQALPDNGKKPFTLTNGDSLAFLNLSGQTGRRELLVKDRYSNFWIFNSRPGAALAGTGPDRALSLSRSTSTATAATSSRSAIRSGTTAGGRLWSHDEELNDHADGLAVGNFSGDPKAEPRVYAWGSDEGFLLFDRRGTIHKHVRIGHAQTASVGKFLPRPARAATDVHQLLEEPRHHLAVRPRRQPPGQEEPIHSGSPMLPVNWRGDGQEFVLLSGNVREGGMIDGQIRRVVMFPDDGHPDLAAYVAERDRRRPRRGDPLGPGARLDLHPGPPLRGRADLRADRNPDYNESNYRTVVSLPGWAEAGRRSAGDR